MSHVMELDWVPIGYRVISMEAEASVECERGCGWRIRLTTLAGLPRAARDQLFRYHENWHTNRR
jgi:hypothetical protein